MCRCPTSCAPAATAVRGEAPKLRHWVKEVKAAMADLEIESQFAERSVNEGFSGGEKKRHEILQLGLLKPGSRSSTRPTPDSTSMPCALSARASAAMRRPSTRGVRSSPLTPGSSGTSGPSSCIIFVDGRIVGQVAPWKLTDELERTGTSGSRIRPRARLR